MLVEARVLLSSLTSGEVQGELSWFVYRGRGDWTQYFQALPMALFGSSSPCLVLSLSGS